MAAMSVAQAALRMILRHMMQDLPRSDIRLQQLVLASMIAGHSNQAGADPRWITAAEVGQHLLAILDNPEAFPGPILKLKSRKQVGLPE